MTPEDVDAIIPVIFERGQGYFSEFWTKSLTEEQRKVLSLVIRGETIDQDLQVIVKQLIKKEVLEKTEAGYDFQVPLLRRYLIEKKMEVLGGEYESI